MRSALKQKQYYYLFYWCPVYAFAALIFGLSSIPVSPSTEIPVFHFAYSDKLFHCVFYAFFCFLVMRALSVSQKKFRIISIYANGLIGSTLYGILNEFSQSILPTRNADFWDALANFSGALLAVVCVHQMRYIYAKRERYAKTYRSAQSGNL